ncbi:hypothetical protein [Methanobrevibacter curvatus]|uniref:Class III signal peptide n=1 Tax=Methanobrevibacter curvatus TaxID=49547 RepID=A0A166CQH9_9EURY|nr:hypothetical protein [Methanobrevibacter curvatus]KZX14764.1 hypothetical protein MBCUR_03760 [Methanobrevibacter curvatus]
MDFKKIKNTILKFKTNIFYLNSNSSSSNNNTNSTNNINNTNSANNINNTNNNTNNNVINFKKARQKPIDNHGQLSIELILILMITIIILITITLPILSTVIDTSLDGSDILESKAEISKLANAVDRVYSEGRGSKETVNLNLPWDLRVAIYSDGLYLNQTTPYSKLSFTHVLSDGSFKTVEFNLSCGNLNEELYLSKGINNIAVNWPLDTDAIEITSV